MNEEMQEPGVRYTSNCIRDLLVQSTECLMPLSQFPLRVHCGSAVGHHLTRMELGWWTTHFVVCSHLYSKQPWKTETVSPSEANERQAYCPCKKAKVPATHPAVYAGVPWLSLHCLPGTRAQGADTRKCKYSGTAVAMSSQVFLLWPKSFVSSVRICKLWQTESEKGVNLQRKAGVQLITNNDQISAPLAVLWYQCSFPPIDFLT